MKSADESAKTSTGDDELVMVSFRLKKEMKEKVASAAQEHGRTISKQFAQSLEDGLRLQGLIGEISDHLTEKIEMKGKVFVHEPDEEECIDYIIAATKLVMDKERSERETAE